MRVVLDTNVLVSASLRTEGSPAGSPPSREGNPGVILRLAAEGKFELFVSPFILHELEIVLSSPKIGFASDKVKETLDAIKQIAQEVKPKTKVSIIQTKESDNRILECALEAKANVLVTGNMADIRPLGLFQEIEILTPREFLNKYFLDT